MKLHNLLGNRQAESGPSIQRIDLEEPVTHPGEMRFADADSAVPHDYSHFTG
ncbi:hypothetical protein D3C74_387150 [compost metagenome]